MTDRKAVLTLITSVVGLLLSSPSLFGQTRPASHWSNFNKDANACACHLFASDALKKEGLNIVEDSGAVLIADNDQVIAEVACKPGERQIFVSAFSSDSATAERIRNNVRATIVNSHLFDTCP